MKYVVKRILSVSLLFFLLNLPVFAHHIQVDSAWSPEAAPVAQVMAAYMNITNNSNQPSVITAVTSPQFGKVEIHSMTHENGMMHMEKQENLSIPAGKTFSLEPGNYHMMLFKPKQWYKAGSKITLHITLDDKYTFPVRVLVIKR